MAYISSNENRFYVALEPAYGQMAAGAAFNRIPAVKLTVQQKQQKADRKDKTGSRTFTGYPSALRRSTAFTLKTYMRDWADQTKEPGYGPLLQGCLGQPAALGNPLSVSSTPGSAQITFAGPHGLNPGQAVAYGAELRFVSAVVNAQTVQLNAPFSVQPAPGTSTGITATYALASELSGVSILDCWSPASAVQRAIYGAAVDALQVQVNGDYHEFQFSGTACDVIDSSSFQQGQAGLSAYPSEPLSAGFDYAIVPGHLGQVWLGSAPSEFFTLTSASIKIENNTNLRDQEFGSSYARGISPGIRNVSVDFSLYQQDDSQTPALYQAARQQSPVSVMLQLGQQAGQLTAIYLKEVVLQTPEFDDSEVRQQWSFKSSRAQGISDDEIFIAFG